LPMGLIVVVTLWLLWFRSCEEESNKQTARKRRETKPKNKQSQRQQYLCSERRF
jgi:hypothetical protein